jgi:hypothetical protein
MRIVMKDLNYISQEILKGRNLKENLNKYATGIASLYNGLAYIKLSMNYYTVYDMLKEKEFSDEEYLKLFDEFNSIIDEILNGKWNIDKIGAIRDKIISIMEVVTDYVDCLRIYEYVLNRIEHRFSEQDLDEEYYGTYLTNDIMHYILQDNDNVVVNSKISEVVGQLPMRLSKNKFYEYIKDAFSLYHGAQKGTIDDFVYALKTSAMLRKTDGFKEMFPEMYDIINTLSNADYANADEQEYNRLQGALQIATEKMTACADMFVLLAQMVNDAYTIILTADFTLDNVSEVDNALSIISQVRKAIDKNYADTDEDVLQKFVKFEGKQERILMIISKCDYAIDEALNNYNDELKTYDLYDRYQKLSKVVKLQSGSDFVTLEKDKSDIDIPDDTYADNAAEELIKLLDESFKNHSQIVKRAVMSSVMSQLPVFFNNTKEIQDYINISLEQCADKAERMAVIEVMKMIMQ